MKFSCRWIADYVDLGMPAADAGAAAWRSFRDDLAQRLTAVGLNVEDHELVVATADETFEDLVLDIDVTTNRPDCMNHVGLAREIATLLGRDLKPPSGKVAAGEGAAPVRVTIEDAEGCPRYVALAIAGVRVGPSPAWLRRRLEAIGQRAINNVVDVTNFVLWESGQPLHAFDLDQLPGGEIRVRRARAGERLTTLDGIERKLEPEVLVIADAERPVALAGIMGGQASEVSSRTRRLLVESAHFDRRRTRLGARALGMHTDASHRFERGSDPEGCAAAAERAAALLADLAGATPEGPRVDVRGASLPPIAWRLESARLAAFAGLAVPDDEIERILAGLGFAPRGLPGGFAGEVPSFRRFDFEPRPVARDGARRLEAYPADLYEEVLRHHGLDALPATLPRVPGVDAGENLAHRRATRIRRHLAACGLAEAIDFAFHDAASEAAYPALSRVGPPLGLANPLSDRYAVLRRSLLPDLVGAAGFNTRRGAGAVRLFEIGHLFPGDREAEIEAVAIVVGGQVGTPWNRRPELDLFDLEGIVESLAAELGATLVARPATLARFVPGTGAELVDPTGAPVGFCGQVEGADTPFPLYAAELRTEALVAPAGAGLTVDVPSRFPGVAADFTLTHALDLEWREVATAIAAAAVPDLAEFGLKDRYRGAGVPTGAVNTTIAFLYNAAERSLTQEEVNDRHLALVGKLERRFGFRKPEGA